MEKSVAEQVVDFTYSLREDGSRAEIGCSIAEAIAGTDQRRHAMYRVMWWDAYGDAQITEKMSKEKAEIVLSSMHSSQEARLVFVK